MSACAREREYNFDIPIDIRKNGIEISRSIQTLLG